MRISTRARYALRMMLDIARNGEGGHPVSLADVAERTDLSRGYLEQLTAPLRTQHLLKGFPGKQGGYRLTRPADSITLRQIIEAAIGPVAILDCLEDSTTCLRAGDCECRVVYGLINEEIRGVLEAFTLEDLKDPRLKGELEGKLEARRREARH
ncbi:MAG: Rrf2 family transcriptional regulator [Acidobacteriota bacterium]